MRILGAEKRCNESWDRFIFGLKVQYLSSYIDFLEVYKIPANELSFDKFLTEVCEVIFYHKERKTRRF